MDDLLTPDAFVAMRPAPVPLSRGSSVHDFLLRQSEPNQTASVSPVHRSPLGLSDSAIVAVGTSRAAPLQAPAPLQHSEPIDIRRSAPASLSSSPAATHEPRSLSPPNANNPAAKNGTSVASKNSAGTTVISTSSHSNNVSPSKQRCWAGSAFFNSPTAYGLPSPIFDPTSAASSSSSSADASATRADDNASAVGRTRSASAPPPPLPDASDAAQYDTFRSPPRKHHKRNTSKAPRPPSGGSARKMLNLDQSATGAAPRRVPLVPANHTTVSPAGHSNASEATQLLDLLARAVVHAAPGRSSPSSADVHLHHQAHVDSLASEHLDRMSSHLKGLLGVRA